jgi:hypothetical protein
VEETIVIEPASGGFPKVHPPRIMQHRLVLRVYQVLAFKSAIEDVEPGLVG